MYMTCSLPWWSDCPNQWLSKTSSTSWHSGACGSAALLLQAIKHLEVELWMLSSMSCRACDWAVLVFCQKWGSHTVKYLFCGGSVSIRTIPSSQGLMTVVLVYKIFVTEDVMEKSKFKQIKHKVFTSKHPACYILLVSEWWYYEGLFWYYCNTWVIAN